MKSRYFQILMLLLFSLSSCKKEQKPKGVTISPFERSPSKPYFESVKLITLESDSTNLLSGDLKIKLIGDYIYILDTKIHQSVFRFAKNGTFLNQIGKKGKGPNEYINPKDFIVNNDTIEILSGIGDKCFISVYNTGGNYFFEKEFNLVATNFEKVKNNYLFYTSYNKGVHPFRLYLNDRNGINLNTFFPNNSEINLPMFETNFFRLDSSLIFKEAFNYSIYSWKNNDFICTYIVDLGKLSIPEQFYKKPIMEGFEMINKRGFVIIKSAFENENYLAIELTLQKQTEVELFHYIFNKATTKSSLTKINVKEKSIFKNLVSITRNNELVYMAFPEELTENQKELSNFQITNPQILLELNKNLNPVLLLCKINLK